MGFEVQFGPAAEALDLAQNNPDLLAFAALTGENVSVTITRKRQTVISQDGVYLYLDCSAVLHDLEEEDLPTVSWNRECILSCPT